MSTKTLNIDYDLYKEELEAAKKEGYIAAMADCLYFVSRKENDKEEWPFIYKVSLVPAFIDQVYSLKMDAQSYLRIDADADAEAAA